MHEWALAEGVLATAVDVAARESLSTITRIEVHIGELQSIKPDVFEFALKSVIPKVDPELRSARIELTTVAARFGCRACSREFTLSAGSRKLSPDDVESIHFVPELAHVYLSCPACSSPDFEVLAGRGVWLHAVEGD